MKINWINILDCIAKTTLWILLFWNLYSDRIDYAMVYALVVIAWAIDDIATNIKVKNNE